MKLVPPNPELSELVATDRRVCFLVSYIESHIGDPVIDITHLAAEVGLSPSQVRRIFRHTLQRSVRTYILEERLTRARHLLLNTFLSVKEVMVTVGMTDPSRFSRVYRRTFGVSPSDERRRAAMPKAG